MKDMFSIGELAGYQNISKQTLIFYDKIGLFQPAYVDPSNKYRYYTAKQIDYLDTILIMKAMGFSLGEIQEHMKNYTIDTSIVALRKQLTVLDQQITHLQLVRNRLAHRCRQMENVKAFHEQNQEATIKEVPERYLLYAGVEAPRSFREISIATKKCFSQALRDELPIFFQTGVIVPYEHILQGRYTEASRKQIRRRTSACFPREGLRVFTTAAHICPRTRPIRSCCASARSIGWRSSRTRMSFASTTISPPAMRTNISRRSSSIFAKKRERLELRPKK